MQPTDRRLANAIRALAMDAVEAANSGHPGMPMGMADAATALVHAAPEVRRVRPALARPRPLHPVGRPWLDADLRLALSDRLRAADDRRHQALPPAWLSPTAGHPENFELAGVEVTTGPLGQGVAMAVGMAIAERHLNAVYGDDLVDHRTFVIAGDGDLMEGINHEAVGLAGHLQLGRLIVLWDDNNITIDGSTDLSRNEDVIARHQAAQWHTCECNGLDSGAVDRAIKEALADPRPSLIRCKTIIGFGAPNKQGTAATHGAALGADEVAAARVELGWDLPPFEIPDDVLTAWRTAGKRGSVDHAQWTGPARTRAAARTSSSPASTGKVSDAWLKPYLDKLLADLKPVATRKASEMALEAINAAIPATIGGSADLTGSNNTRTKALAAADVRTITAAATSITASASSAWRRR